MLSECLITTIDSHTAGMPTRLVVSGFPEVPGASMADKRQYIIDNYDFLVRMIIDEPRGHIAMRGGVLFPPTRPDTDAGVVFIGGGCMPSCGHSSIGVAVSLIETGRVKVKEPLTKIVLETPAGVTETRTEVCHGMAGFVTFRNVPAFLFAEDVKLDVPGIGNLQFDIGYGGNFFAILSAEQVGLTVEPANVPRFVQAAGIIKEAVNKAIKVTHPENSIYDHLTHVEFYGPPSHKDAHVKNIVISPPGMVDRSPCGTGTCAKMAVLHAKGKLGLGEEFIHENVIGEVFKGKLCGTIRVGDRQAVVPEISGTAHLTGLHTFLADPRDSLRYGFRLA